MDTIIQTTKPNLYLDVDGVFFALYGDPVCYQIRPGAHSFLKWAVMHFNCKWLTCWSKDHLLSKKYRVVDDDGTIRDAVVAGFMLLGYMYTAGEDCEYIDWHRVPRRWSREHSDKVDAIDVPNEDFYWLEDGIDQAAERVLKEHHKYDRYFYVDERGEDGLIIARRWLEQKLRERSNEQVRAT